MRSFTYFFKRKYRQIRNLIKWTPIIWKQFDFDYSYVLEVFKFKLEQIADFMESDRAATVGASQRASRIRTAIKLMNKVYEEEYAREHIQKFEEIYGKGMTDFTFIKYKDNPKYSQLIQKYELLEDKEKVSEMRSVYEKLFNESIEKQKKAERILWAFIGHNIRGWWD